MRVTIRSPHLNLDDELREYIGETVRHALTHAESRITTVQVHVADENGPKGGLDMKCELVANCGKLGVVRTDAVDKDMRRAVDAAATKLQRAVEHSIDHKRGARKSGTPHRRSGK